MAGHLYERLSLSMARLGKQCANLLGWAGGLVVLLVASPDLPAVLPENGLYIPGELEPGDPSVVAAIEVQGAHVHFSLVAFDSVSGRPSWYVSQGSLRDDAISPGPIHPPPISTGFYPLHAFEGDLERIEGGNCVTCSTAPVQWQRSIVGRIALFFPSTSGVLADIRLDPNQVPSNGFRTTVLSLRRYSFGRARVLLVNSIPNGPPSFVHHDLRGQWVFVDQADAGGAVRDALVRYDFTEQILAPQPFIGPNYAVTYRDPTRGAEFRCTSVGTSVGQKGSGCELHTEGRILFSARREDIGMDRIQAFRGELPTIVALIPTVTDPYRRPGQVIGLRVNMPPPGPLGPASEPPSGSDVYGDLDPIRERTDPTDFATPAGRSS